MLSMLAISSCNAQQDKTVKLIDTAASQNQPKVTSKVNKRYDKNGNLIGYDSTYTWSYSSKSVKPGRHVDADSVWDSFKRQFNMGFHMMPTGIWTDSTFDRQFGTHGFFKSWDNGLPDVKAMMQQTDSMRNSFFERSYQTFRPRTEI